MMVTPNVKGKFVDNWSSEGDEVNAAACGRSELSSALPFTPVSSLILTFRRRSQMSASIWLSIMTWFLRGILLDVILVSPLPSVTTLRPGGLWCCCDGSLVTRFIPSLGVKLLQ